MEIPLEDIHPAIAPVIHQLERIGVATVKQFLKENDVKLQQKTGLTGISKIKDAIRKRILEQSRRPIETVKMPTSLENLDELLEGGFESGTLNEFIGCTGSGKTYLTQFLSCRILSNNDFGVLILVNRSSGVANSIQSIFKGFNCDPEVVAYLMKKVKIRTFSEVEHLLERLKLLSHEENPDLITHKIILLDGLASQFLLHYQQLNRTFNRQISNCLQLLRKIAQQNGILVFITGLIYTRNEVGLQDWEITDRYCEVTDRDWPSLLDNRFLIHRYDSLDDDDQLEITRIKSRQFTTGKKCRISFTSRGLE